jgi:thioredoxin-like negative regulator of GroEL
MAQLQNTVSQQSKFLAMGHGVYTEITEPEFLQAVTKSPRVVVHFYHDEFARCKAVDKNLSLIAPLILGCRFLKINANKCPFFVSKLNIKILPTIVYFIQGKSVHRLVGFTELGGIDDFAIKSFIENLRTHKMLQNSDESKWKQYFYSKEEENDDYSDNDSL